jgi:hypothetical protein
MVNKLKYLKILTTDEENKLSKEGSVDIDNSDSVCNSGSSGSSSGSVSKSSNCRERESSTEEFKDD